MNEDQIRALIRDEVARLFAERERPRLRPLSDDPARLKSMRDRVTSESFFSPGAIVAELRDLGLYVTPDMLGHQPALRFAARLAPDALGAHVPADAWAPLVGKGAA